MTQLLNDNKEQLLNLLVAYPYMTQGVINAIQDNKEKIRFVLDSGAFTAWKSGSPIQLDDYCRFLESLPFTPWRYFSLDVIGDPKASLKNYETMLNRGFNPVPIFTRGECPTVLDDYYKTSDVVGIGGLVGTPRNKGFINGIMKHINGRKVHWLGFTSINFIKHYKPYMCDSSSWEGGARYGRLSLYLGGGKTKTIKKSDFQNKPSEEVLRALKLQGVNPSDLAKASSWHGGNSLIRYLSAKNSVFLSLDIQKNLKTFVFQAASTNLAISLLIKGFEEIKKC